MSLLKLGILGILRSLRILGDQPKEQYGCAQLDSEMSNLAIRPLCPYCPLCPLVLKTTPAQRDSKNSILGVGGLGILRILGIL